MHTNETHISGRYSCSFVYIRGFKAVSPFTFIPFIPANLRSGYLLAVFRRFSSSRV